MSGYTNYFEYDFVEQETDTGVAEKFELNDDDGDKLNLPTSSSDETVSSSKDVPSPPPTEEIMDPKLDPDYRRDSFEYKKSEAVELPIRPHSFDVARPETPKKSKNKDDRKQAAVLFNLWERNSPQKNIELSDLEAVKGLPSNPTITDLKKVVFSISNDFEPNEIVLVPRTRGGFSYARVTKSITKKNCYFDSKVEHKNSAWRVVYSSNSKSLFKELPPPYIGKLPDGPSLRDSDMKATLAAESEEFDSSRPVGEPSHFKDLQNVVFSPSCNFSIDEVVLIPRTSGGFTYGTILKETNMNCRVGGTFETHPLLGWRVMVGGGDPNNPVRKDLISACIGKLTLISQKDPIPANYKNATTVDSKYALIKESEMNALKKTPKNLPVDEEPLEKNPIDSKKLISETSNPSHNNQIGGLLQVQVDKKDLLNQLLKHKTDPINHLIVIDGPNVAKKHGKENEFSAKGIKIALDYWNAKGHDAIAFLPEHHVKRKQGQEITLKEFLPLINNLPLLNKLIEEGRVILTPPQDYDDSYCIQYAMSHNGCIVTNDRYNDYIEKAKNEKGNRGRQEALKWIREHCISFTFVRDDFLPNPDFRFPPINSK